MVSEKDLPKLRELYFEKFYNYSQLIAYFNNKYTYAELKTAISKSLKAYKGPVK